MLRDILIGVTIGAACVVVLAALLVVMMTVFSRRHEEDWFSADERDAALHRDLTTRSRQQSPTDEDAA